MKYFITLLLTSSLTLAQVPQPPVQAKQNNSASKELLNKIFSQLEKPEFHTAIKEARTAGIPEQTLLEARFLNLIDHDDLAGLAKLAPELTAFNDKFDLKLSQVFGVKEDWLSVIQYTKAIAALEKNDAQNFKKHITEAFWLNPRHAQIYAPHIERLRLKQTMANVTIPGDLTLQNQEDGKTTSLNAINEGQQATILHLWSPISPEVVENIPDFILTSRECAEHNIAVISVLVGQSPESFKDAELIRTTHQSTAKCSWIIDTKESDLTNKLRITEVPTMIILSKEGKVLFNGHPSEPKFWKTIQNIAPKFQRPTTPDNKNENDE